jgi:amino-acid N-acetyltransferase
MNLTPRKAKISDSKNIHALLLQTAEVGLVLPRSLPQIYANIRDFFVLHCDDGQLIGCCALSVVWDNLAEIRSLVIIPALRRKGAGRLLLEACLAEAGQLGINRVFALTYQVEFFARMRFNVVSKDVLPQKVWTDCVNCPKFPDCDEVAVLLEL